MKQYTSPQAKAEEILVLISSPVHYCVHKIVSDLPLNLEDKVPVFIFLGRRGPILLGV
jgi:hypothetical protein